MIPYGQSKEKGILVIILIDSNLYCTVTEFKEDHYQSRIISVLMD